MVEVYCIFGQAKVYIGNICDSSYIVVYYIGMWEEEVVVVCYI